MRLRREPLRAAIVGTVEYGGCGAKEMRGMFRLLGGAIGIIFLIGLLLIIGLLKVIF